MKLHAAKCKLFLREVTWCGRAISADGIKLDPKRLEAIVNMPCPKTSGDLQQLVCAANWMRFTIPKFSRIMETLSKVLEQVYTKGGGRTKRAASKITLDATFWNSDHDQTFKVVKEALRNAVTLAHPDPEKILCLFTDASETNWAGTLTQIPKIHLDEDFENQHHDPLAFLSGSYKKSSFHWSTLEKEAFAIVTSVTRLDYMLMRPEGLILFTDHKNLTFIFHPVIVNLRIAKHTANKIERWAMQLSAFRYTINHISGEDNCWADLLSRWGGRTGGIIHGTLGALFHAPISPDLDPDFTWPKPADIKREQQRGISEWGKHRRRLSGTVFIEPTEMLYGSHLVLRNLSCEFASLDIVGEADIEAWTPHTRTSRHTFAGKR